MKKNLIVLILFLPFVFKTFGQIVECTPDPTCVEVITGLGMLCPEQLGDAEKMLSYEEIITIIPPSNYMGAELTKIVLTDITGLPEGMEWGKQVEEFLVTDPFTRYCVSIYGTPEEVGEFELALHVTPYILYQGIETEGPVQVDDTSFVLTVLPAEGSLTVDFSAEPTQLEEGETVVFTDLSEGYPIQWSWTFEGGQPQFSSQQNPEPVLYTSGGDCYDVTLVVFDGTNTVTETKENFICVEDPVFVAEFSDDENFSIYPNPARDKINIEAEGIVNIKIYDYIGKLIISKDEKTNHSKLDISELPGGMYFIKINTENASITNSFSIVR